MTVLSLKKKTVCKKKKKFLLRDYSTPSHNFPRLALWTGENAGERVIVARKESILDFCPELAHIAQGVY